MRKPGSCGAWLVIAALACTPAQAPVPRVPTPAPAAAEEPPGPVAEVWNGFATALDCAPPGVHVQLHVRVAHFGQWLTESERARLERIDLRGTARVGARRAMAMVEMDVLVRELLPISLQADGRAAWAAQLRRLPRLRDRATLAAASAAIDRIYPPASDEVPNSLYVVSQYLSDFENHVTSETEVDCLEMGGIFSPEEDVVRAALDARAPRDKVAQALIAMVRDMAKAGRAAAP